MPNKAHTTAPSGIPAGAVRQDMAPDWGGGLVIVLVVLVAVAAIWMAIRKNTMAAMAAGALALIGGAWWSLAQMQDHAMDEFPALKRARIMQGFACLVDVGCGTWEDEGLRWGNLWIARRESEVKVKEAGLVGTLKEEIASLGEPQDSGPEASAPTPEPPQ